MKRLCETCGRPIRSDNTVGICSMNPACRRAREQRSPRKRNWMDQQNARNYKRAQDFQERINEIKSASGCVDCGFNVTPLALQFDHLPGFRKLFVIGAAANRSWESVQAEIAKCEVVCANCHFVRTTTRKRAKSNDT